MDTIVNSVMNLSHPTVSLISSLTGYVLEVLAKTTRPLSGREVHRLVARESSHVGVQRVLDELAAQGLVIQQETGRAILNTLNREHILAPIVIELVALKDRIPAVIAQIVGEEAPDVDRAVLFGSIAAEDADSESDVDLLLVWPDDVDSRVRDAAGHDIGNRIEQLLGNPCRVLHYAAKEYAGLAEAAPDFAESIGAAHIELLNQEGAP